MIAIGGPVHLHGAFLFNPQRGERNRMTAQLPPSSNEAQASAPATSTPSPQAEAGSQTRAHPQRSQGGIDPALQSQLDKRDAKFLNEMAGLRALIESLKAPAASSSTEAAQPPAALPPASPPAAPASAPAAEQRQNQAPAAEPPASEAQMRAYGVMDAMGVDIDAADPEAGTIDWSSPEKAAKTTRAAIEAKQRRTANAALPVSGGSPVSNPIAKVTDVNELFRVARQNKAW